MQLIKLNFKKNQYFQEFSKLNNKKLLANASLPFSIHETNNLIQSKSSIDTKFNDLIGKTKEKTYKNVSNTKISKAKVN